MDLIKNADHIIDLGPGGGDAGGWVLATGTPEEVTEVEASYTGQYLREVLRRQGAGVKS
ncbi:MAG: excinuclease subunit UvrA [Dehalococcoidia bacterium]|nr:excinuclease subunit UvrA [Dehalococcoidia bacterium]